MILNKNNLENKEEKRLGFRDIILNSRLLMKKKIKVLSEFSISKASYYYVYLAAKQPSKHIHVTLDLIGAKPAGFYWESPLPK